MSYDLGTLGLAGGEKKSRTKVYVAVAAVVVVIVLAVYFLVL